MTMRIRLAMRSPAGEQCVGGYLCPRRYDSARQATRCARRRSPPNGTERKPVAFSRMIALKRSAWPTLHITRTIHRARTEEFCQ